MFSSAYTHIDPDPRIHVRYIYQHLPYKSTIHVGKNTIHGYNRWWFQKKNQFTPIPGQMIQFDLRILFKWVGEKAPYMDTIYLAHLSLALFPQPLGV